MYFLGFTSNRLGVTNALLMNASRLQALYQSETYSPTIFKNILCLFLQDFAWFCQSKVLLPVLQNTEKSGEQDLRIILRMVCESDLEFLECILSAFTVQPKELVI